jgi:hypothetical protein
MPFWRTLSIQGNSLANVDRANEKPQKVGMQLFGAS